MLRHLAFPVHLVLAVSLGGMLCAQVTTLNQAGQALDAGPAQGVRAIVLSDATVNAGLGGVFNDGNTHTCGAAWVDYNGDLLPDLFVTSGSGYSHQLFRNDGAGRFTDVTSIIPKADLSLEESGVKFADIDNDGDYDIFVGVDNPSIVIPNQPVNPSDGGPNLLYINNGDNTFTELASTAGVLNPDNRRTISAGFADYDNDGWIDLYLGGWTLYELPLGLHADFGHLLQNDGDGTFTDVTASLGVDNYGHDALTLQWFDINFDRYPDLYICNVAHTNAPPAFVPIDTFYLNNAGVSFTDQIPIFPYLGDDSQAGMGMDVGDVDNDGDWDLYITDLFGTPARPTGNVLYHTDDQVAGVFDDNTADLASISADSSWPCNYVDFDQDGWIDLWVTGNSVAAQGFLFANDQTGKFRDTNQALLQGLVTQGGSSADFDGDGDVDFVVTKYQQDMQLFQNDSIGQGNWIQFKLYGTSTNRGAIGTVVRVTQNGITQMRRVSGGDSAHSQSDSILHFGVDQAMSVDVVVEWPSGTDQSFANVSTNSLVLIDEDAGILAPTVSDDGSSWSAEGQFLDVRIKSNYGGRIDLQVDGLGPLRFDTASQAHVARFNNIRNRPSSLSVQSSSGAMISELDFRAQGR